MTIRPTWREPSSPMCFHVLPPSSDLYTPSPHEELRRLFASPVPTHTMFGFEGASAIEPTETVVSRSNTGIQELPRLVVFHTPPDAVAAYTTSVLFSTTATSITRPPVVAGPIVRHLRFLSIAGSTRT